MSMNNPPPSTGNGTGTGPVPAPQPNPPNNRFPYNRYPYNRYPYYPYYPYDPRNNIPFWLYDRYNTDYYPQTIVVPTVPTTTSTIVTTAPPATTTMAAADQVSDAVSSFASLWPLLLSIAASLILIIAIFAAVMYIGRAVYNLVAPKPVVVATATGPDTVVL